jgi:hypothetical protein
MGQEAHPAEVEKRSRQEGEWLRLPNNPKNCAALKELGFSAEPRVLYAGDSEPTEPRGRGLSAADGTARTLNLPDYFQDLRWRIVVWRSRGVTRYKL